MIFSAFLVKSLFFCLKWQKKQKNVKKQDIESEVFS